MNTFHSISRFLSTATDVVRRAVFFSVTSPGAGVERQVDTVSDHDILDLDFKTQLEGLDDTTGATKITELFRVIKEDLKTRFNGLTPEMVDDAAQVKSGTEDVSGMDLTRAMKRLFKKVTDMEAHFTEKWTELTGDPKRLEIMDAAGDTFSAWIDAFVETSGSDENLQYMDLDFMDLTFDSAEALVQVVAPDAANLNKTTAGKFFDDVLEPLRAMHLALGVAKKQQLTDEQREYIRTLVTVPLKGMYANLAAEQGHHATTAARQTELTELEGYMDTRFRELRSEFAEFGIDPERRQAAIEGAGYTAGGASEIASRYKGNPFATVLQMILKFFGVDMQLVWDESGAIAGWGRDPAVVVASLEAQRQARDAAIDTTHWSQNLQDRAKVIKAKDSVWAGFIPPGRDLSKVVSKAAEYLRAQVEFDTQVEAVRKEIADDGKIADADAFVAERLVAFNTAGAKLVPDGTESAVGVYQGQAGKSMSIKVFVAWIKAEAAAKVAADEAAAVVTPDALTAEYEAFSRPTFQDQAGVYSDVLSKRAPFTKQEQLVSLKSFETFMSYLDAGSSISVGDILNATITGTSIRFNDGVEVQLAEDIERFAPGIKVLKPKFGSEVVGQDIDIVGSVRCLQEMLRFHSNPGAPFDASTLFAYLQNKNFEKEWHAGLTRDMLSGYSVTPEEITDAEFVSDLRTRMLRQNLLTSLNATLSCEDWITALNKFMENPDETVENGQRFLALRFLIRTRRISSTGDVSLSAFIRLALESEEYSGISSSLVETDAAGDRTILPYPINLQIAKVPTAPAGIQLDEWQKLSKREQDGLLQIDETIKNTTQFTQLHTFVQKYSKKVRAPNMFLFQHETDPTKNFDKLRWSDARHILAKVIAVIERGGLTSSTPSPLTIIHNSETYTFNQGGGVLNNLAELRRNPLFSSLMRTDSELPLYQLVRFLAKPASSTFRFAAINA